MRRSRRRAHLITRVGCLRPPMEPRQQAMCRSCSWAPRWPPPRRRSSALWRSCVRGDDTAAPKLRPIPGYRWRDADARPRASAQGRSGCVFGPRDGGRGGAQQRSHRGGLPLKWKIAVCAATLAFAAFGTGSVSAQPVPPGYYPAPDDGTALPLQEVAAIVRSTGLEPLGRPLRQGPVYVSRALDPSGQEVRVIINAQMGRVVRIVPVTMPRYGVPVVRPPGRIVMAPDNYGPDPRGPGPEGMPPSGPPQGAAAAAPPAGPPLPRPRPKLAETDQSVQLPETTGTARPVKPTQPPAPLEE